MRILIQLGLAMSLVCACGPEHSGTQRPLVERRQSALQTFVHPLQNVDPADRVSGKAVGVDIWDSPDGRVFAVVDRFTVDAQGIEAGFSGVEKLEVRKLTPQEQQARAAAKGLVLLPKPAPVIDPLSQQQISASLPSAKVSLSVSLREPPGLIDIGREVERAIALGTATSESTMLVARKTAILQRQAQIAAVQLPVLSAIGGLNGEVAYLCKNLLCLGVRLEASKVASLAALPGVAAVSISRTVSSSALRGREVASGIQHVQLTEYENGAFGAIIEMGGYNALHPGFKEDSGANSRIAGKMTCDCPGGPYPNGCSCLPVAGWNYMEADFSDFHGTRVAGLMFGDLTDGQDPAVSGALDRIDRSGYAREATALLIGLGGWRESPQELRNVPTQDELRIALDYVAGLPTAPVVLNMSLGFQAPHNQDPNCLGQTPVARDLDEVFEHGTLPVMAAGNEGHPAYTCTLREPAAAMGAFVVGGHTTSLDNTENDVRYGGISSFSNRGGGWWAPANRTIVDLTAPAYRKLTFIDNSGYGDPPSPGTSFSAPTVSGGALQYLRWYQQNVSNALDNNPGLLHTHLLLMGDRQGESSVLATGFDSLWGAGRFKMRRFKKADGMLDRPAEFSTGTTCVQQGQDVVLKVLYNGQRVPSDVDALKAVIWWYDKRHHDGVLIDDIDLYLDYSDDGVNWTVASASAAGGSEEKERVYVADLSGDRYWRLRVSGWRVTADDTGCGQDRMKVHWAYFYEDSDRDDGINWNYYNGNGQHVCTDKEDYGIWWPFYCAV